MLFQMGRRLGLEDWRRFADIMDGCQKDKQLPGAKLCLSILWITKFFGDDRSCALRHPLIPETAGNMPGIGEMDIERQPVCVISSIRFSPQTACGLT